MATFDEVLQEYVNLPYDRLLSIACKSLNDFSAALDKNIEKQETRTTAVLILISACIAADGRFSQLEYKFITDILGTDHGYEKLKGMVSSFGIGEGAILIDKFLDVCPDAKKPALAFCLCFLAVDETITREEVAFINKLIE